MATNEITVNVGYTDSITTPKELSIPDLDYAKDFAVVTDEPGSLVLTNITSPIDQPEKIRWGYQNINNVYANSGIDPAYYAPSKRGISIVSQVSEVWKVGETTDTCGCPLPVYLPVEGHVVFKVPTHSAITENMVEAFLRRVMDTLYATGSVSPERIGKLMRGSLRPEGL